MGRHVAESPVDARRRDVGTAQSNVAANLAAEYRALGIDPALAAILTEQPSVEVPRVSATAHQGRAVVLPELGRFVSPQYRRGGVS